MNYATVEYKPVSERDCSEPHLGSIVSIGLECGKSIACKLVELSGPYFTIEHRDGRKSKVRRRDISLLSPIPQADDRERY
jgi:hypothetical protein